MNTSETHRKDKYAQQELKFVIHSHTHTHVTQTYTRTHLHTRIHTDACTHADMHDILHGNRLATLPTASNSQPGLPAWCVNSTCLLLLCSAAVLFCGLNRRWVLLWVSAPFPCSFQHSRLLSSLSAVLSSSVVSDFANPRTEALLYSVHGRLQARVLTMPCPYPGESSHPRDGTRLS